MPERLATVGIVDSGGRAHVLAEKYAQSPYVGHIVVMPGNDLISQTITNKKVTLARDVGVTDVDGMIKTVNELGINLVDVAQDEAVAADAVNRIWDETAAYVMGPSKEAGELESSKEFGRNQARAARVPQPRYSVFHSQEEGIDYVERSHERPVFIKASGLAAGKGAVSAHDRQEAIAAIKKMKGFSNGAGDTFLIEEWLRNEDGTPGREFSSFIVSDGEHFRYLGSAQDYKRVGDGDEGENTGGMGALTPNEIITPQLLGELHADFFKKIIDRMERIRARYEGILYTGGIAVSENGIVVPKLVEFNARWGDPEAEVLVPGILNDFYDIAMSVSRNNVAGLHIKTDGLARVSVAGASRGYPGDYSDVKGKRIYGLKDAMRQDGVQVFGAGVAVRDGEYFANGGRLFHVVGEGKTVPEARDRAYDAIARVKIEGDSNNLHFRTDIAA